MAVVPFLRTETFARPGRSLRCIPADAEGHGSPAEDYGLEPTCCELKPHVSHVLLDLDTTGSNAGFAASTPITTSDGGSTRSKTLAFSTTPIVYLASVGANGQPGAEGTINGTFHELLRLNGRQLRDNAESMASHSGRVRRTSAYNQRRWLGTRDGTGRYNGPKQVPPHWGGTRNGHHRANAQWFQRQG